MGTLYYAMYEGSVIVNSDRSVNYGDDTNVTGWLKAGKLIYCVPIGYNGKDTQAGTYTLQWKGGGQSTYVNLGAGTGELVAAATGTSLTEGGTVTGPKGSGKEAMHTAVSGQTWADLANTECTDGTTGSIDLASDNYTELQFAVDPANATLGATYLFQVYAVAQSAAMTQEAGAYATLTMANVPTVTTQDCDPVGSTTATGKGTITATGDLNATRRGFCYKEGTSGDPTTADSTVYDDGSFIAEAYSKGITGLTPSTGYRVRAYAVNPVGTSYGSTVQLTTTSGIVNNQVLCVISNA